MRFIIDLKSIGKVIRLKAKQFIENELIYLKTGLFLFESFIQAGPFLSTFHFDAGTNN